jgi:hypothetical protein
MRQFFDTLGLKEKKSKSKKWSTLLPAPNIIGLKAARRQRLLHSTASLERQQVTDIQSLTRL